MDNSVMMWDVRPFANQNRLEKTFRGIKVRFVAHLTSCVGFLVCFFASLRMYVGSGWRNCLARRSGV